MTENNVKYIPEMWLEGDKDDDLKIAFMTALFNQWQGHFDDEGKGFNADRVDDWHRADIEKAIYDSTVDKLSSFYIGKTFFNETEKPVEGKYTLGFDAIKLYNPDDSVVNPAYENKEKTLPWADLTNKTPEEFVDFLQNYTFINPNTASPTLYDVLRELFIITREGSDSKLDKSVFDNYREETDPLISIVKHYDDKGYYQEIEDDETGDITYLYNADQLNGFRIFVCTPAMYEELPDEIKEDPHNLVFMIDEEDLHEDGDITKPIKYNIENPNVCPISQYYSFKVDIDPVSGKQVLFYKHPSSNVWINMGVTADDFLDNQTLSLKVEQVLNSSTNYTLNSSVFKNSFVNLTVDPSTDSYPFLDYLKDYYIHGGIYTKADGTVGRANIETFNGDGYHYINLDNPINVLKDNINSSLNNINSTLTTYGTRLTNTETVATQGKNNANTALTQINSLKGGSTKTIQDLDTRIISLETNTLTKDSTEWTGYILGGLEEYIVIDRTKYYSYTAINEALDVGYLHINTSHYHKASNSGKWVELQSNVKFNNKMIGSIYNFAANNPNFGGVNKIYQTSTSYPELELLMDPVIPQGYRPIHPTKHSMDLHTIMLFNNDGKLKVQCNLSNDKVININGTIFYKRWG